MRIPKREPNCGYFDSWLWLPKSHVSVQQVAGALTYQVPKGEVVAWRETKDHILVPRHFFLPETRASVAYPIYDARWRSYPRVTIRSKVELDKFSGGLTYQRDGAAALLATHDGILCLRTGAGKTVVGLHAAAQLGVPVLIVVKDEGLGEQWKDAVLACTDVAEEDIGRIDGKHKLVWRKPITIASVQTLARRVAEGTLDPRIPRYFGVVLVDECHTMGAPYFNAAIPPFQGRRWGLSATPNREDGLNSLLQYTLGDVVYTHLMPEMIPEVVFVQLPTRLDMRDKEVLKATHVWKESTRDPGTFGYEFHYGKAFGYLATLPERSALILKHVNAAVASGRQVVVISQSKAVCSSLAEQVPGSGLVVGAVRGKERIRRIRENNPLFVISQLGIEALDKQSLDTLFVTDPYKKTRMLQQSMGRILRSGTKSNRKRVVVFFEDVYIRPLSIMCGKIRKALGRWPEIKGGRINFRIISEVP
jgi:superfamily II DNA or RNA helicase